jgi:APA family basic amino acid/polyamine antiporter
VPYAYSAAAQVVMFYRDRELFSGARFARDTVIAALAFAYSAWAIWGAGEEVVAKGFMLLLAGIPVYVWLKWRQSRIVPPDWEVSLQRPPPPREQATPRPPAGAR